MRSEPEETLPPEPTAVETTISLGGTVVEGRLVRIDTTFFRPDLDRAWMGRLPVPEEHRPGATAVVVLGQELWKDLGGTPDILGERLEVDGSTLTVIGVMPPQYREGEGPTAWVPG
jgi:hypothetical protein